jgi:hypothetical protein
MRWAPKLISIGMAIGGSFLLLSILFLIFYYCSLYKPVLVKWSDVDVSFLWRASGTWALDGATPEGRIVRQGSFLGITVWVIDNNRHLWYIWIPGFYVYSMVVLLNISFVSLVVFWGRGIQKESRIEAAKEI